jgi:hypothetical protein
VLQGAAQDGDQVELVGKALEGLERDAPDAAVLVGEPGAEGFQGGGGGDLAQGLRGFLAGGAEGLLAKDAAERRHGLVAAQVAEGTEGLQLGGQGLGRELDHPLGGRLVELDRLQDPSLGIDHHGARSLLAGDVEVLKLAGRDGDPAHHGALLSY